MWITIFINKDKKPIASCDNFYQAIMFIQLNYSNMQDIEVKYYKKSEVFTWHLKVPIAKKK
jgi:hypothetical protein